MLEHFLRRTAACYCLVGPDVAGWEEARFYDLFELFLLETIGVARRLPVAKRHEVWRRVLPQLPIRVGNSGTFYQCFVGYVAP
eukprot:13232745-Alexandrium_andersonii.AAC.1